MPTITGISGTTAHGGTMTITGTGFGSKAVAAPVAWDDSSGADGNAALLDVWDQAHPSTTTDVSFRMARRVAPFRSVSPPHNRVGRFITGCHSANGQLRNAFNGNNVTVMKDFTVTTPIDLRVYASFWMRFDPLWGFGGDNNMKIFHWADVGNPYSNNANITYEYNPKFTDSSPTFKGWHLYNGHAGTAMLNNGEGNGLFAPTPDVHNPKTGWMKYEVISHYNSAGFTHIYENGRRVVNFNGDADSFNSTSRLFSFGGYGRVGGVNNWRYFTDCYLDTSHARVILGNSDTLDNTCTIREIQVCGTWSDTGITIPSFNRGIFGDAEGAFLFVVDSADVASAGFEIGDAPDPPDPPAPNLVASRIVLSSMPGIAGVRI